MIPKVNGIIDVYYLYNFNKNAAGSTVTNRFYDNKDNDFTLSLAEVSLSGNNDKLSYIIDLDFGDFADLNKAHSDDAITHNIGQANFTYQISDSFSFSAGKMYTHVGYELAKAKDNANYSRAYAFGSGGPFWHEGVALKYAHESGFGAGLFAYDRWDARVENNGSKTFGGQVSFSKDNFSLFYNFITGAEQDNSGDKKMLHELNASYRWSDTVLTALDVINGTEEFNGRKDKKWSSYVLYASFDLTPEFTLSPRIEYFIDSSNISSGHTIFNSAMDVFATTLTAKWALSEQLQWRNEVRYENSDDYSLYSKEDNKLSDNQTTLSSSFIVTF
jgi:hypothetical protein